MDNILQHQKYLCLEALADYLLRIVDDAQGANFEPQAPDNRLSSLVYGPE